MIIIFMLSVKVHIVLVTERELQSTVCTVMSRVYLITCNLGTQHVVVGTAMSDTRLIYCGIPQDCVVFRIILDLHNAFRRHHFSSWFAVCDVC